MLENKKKRLLFITCVLKLTRSSFATLLHACGLRNVPVADGVVSFIVFSLEVFDDDYLQTHITIVFVFYIIVLMMHGGG